MSQPVPSAPADEAPEAPPSSDERWTAALIWLVDIVFGLVGPFILWWFWRKESRFIDHHGRACLNHAATLISILMFVSLVFGAVGILAYLVVLWSDDYKLGEIVLVVIYACIGAIIVALVGLLLFTFVIHLIAAWKALSGQWYTPPLCRRMLVR
jgi:uncharacterized Tic20 family protein